MVTKSAGFDFSRFRLDRNGGSLAEQLAEKVENAVLQGALRHSDRLPTRNEWARALGVSVFVPRRAMQLLSQRGVIDVRRHVGASVSRGFAHSKKKKVIYLSVDRGMIWARAAFSFRLGDQIRKAGFRYERVILPSMKRVRRFGPSDVACTLLDDVLSGGVDFAWVSSSCAWVTRPLAEAGVPFAVVDSGGDVYPEAVGVFRLDGTRVAMDVVRRFKDAGVSSIALVGPGPEVDDLLSSHLYTTGIGFRKIPVNLSGRVNTPEEWQRQSMHTFLKLFAHGRNWMPEAFLFADDFIAAGALLAMTANGIETPRDVKVVSFSNKGLGPVYIRSLTRYENDPERNAEEVARYIVGWLNGSSPRPPDIARRFVAGATL